MELFKPRLNLEGATVDGTKIKILLALHLILMIYSMSGICSKLAATEPFLSIKFCVLYGITILILGFYAIVWQQIIKRISLTTAFANKAVAVAWGLIWSALIFHEPITLGKLAGVILVVLGVILFSKADKEVGK